MTARALLFTSIWAIWLLANACHGAPATEIDYEVLFDATFEPKRHKALVTITVKQPSHNMRRIEFSAPTVKYTAMQGTGSVQHNNNHVVWELPDKGGTLRYEVHVPSLRGKQFDAQITPGWAILRLEDLFPPAKVKTLKNTAGRSQLALHGPSHWRYETRYGSVSQSALTLQNLRKFDRPTGWLIAGDLGIRRAVIAGRKVAIAAPKGSHFRRQDTLAFLHWTLPEVVEVFDQFPDRLLIVGAPEEMWRGGLSGPGSLYLHQKRPFISENGTSPLLHELAHVAGLHSSGPGDDWIVEGLAEYYSLLFLLRSNGIDARRFNRSTKWQQDWSARQDGHLADPSSGANTAFAVNLFHALQIELADQGANIDTIVTSLIRQNPITLDALTRSVEDVLGEPSTVLTSHVEVYKSR